MRRKSLLFDVASERKKTRYFGFSTLESRRQVGYNIGAATFARFFAAPKSI